MKRSLKFQLSPSPKTYLHYKCDEPSNTIYRVKRGFEVMKLSIKENIIQFYGGPPPSIYSVKLKVDPIGFMVEGKGFNKNLARASAYGELAERFSSASFFISGSPGIEEIKLIKPLLKREFIQTDEGDDIFSFKDISRYVDIKKDQYNLLKEFGLTKIATYGYNINEGSVEKIPLLLVDFLSGSNGLCSGNTKEEAISSGIAEVFERFAASQVLQRKLICPTIDLSTIRNRIVQKLLRIYDKLGVKIIIKDFSMGISIPVVGIIFINKKLECSKNPFKKLFFHKMICVSSSINIEEAIIRSLLERVQGLSREEFIWRKRVDRLYSLFKKYGGGFIHTEEDYRFLFTDYTTKLDLSFLEEGETINFRDLPTSKTDDSLDDCKKLLNICEENKWDVIVIDFTHRTLKFPCFRVVIPPLSTSYDPFILKFLNLLGNKEERVDFFYGVKNFHKLLDTQAPMEENSLEEISEGIRLYLSANLPMHRISIINAMFRNDIDLLEAYILLKEKKWKDFGRLFFHSSLPKNIRSSISTICNSFFTDISSHGSKYSS